MTKRKFYRIKQNIFTRKGNDLVQLIDMENETDQNYYELDGLCCCAWNLMLEGDKSLEDLVINITQKYSQTPPDLELQLQNLLDELSDLNLIEVTNV